MQYPKKQYFDKIQLARYCNTWDQLPYIASKGGQASFADFTIRLKKEHKNFVPDIKYYYETIAKAILYINIRKTVKNMNFQGFWANVADYSMSYLSYKTAKRLNLMQIWRDQNIPEFIIPDIENIAKSIYDYLIEHANGRNIQQWCKQKSCWDSIKTDINVSLSFETTSFVGRGSDSTDVLGEATNEEDLLIKDLSSIDSSIWGSISAWGKETRTLAPFQNGIAYSLMKVKRSNKPMSYKQAKQGLIILRTAYENGFVSNENVKAVLEKHADS